jgi:Zinc finger, ZZ type
MLDAYRDQAKSILSKAKLANLATCQLNLELSISQNTETLASTLYCSCSKTSYQKFLELLLPDKVSEIVPDFSLIPNSVCPELTLLSSSSKVPVKLNWSKPYYCLVIWGLLSPNCKKVVSVIEKIAKQVNDIEIISLCLDGDVEINIDNVYTYNAKGFSEISEQGLEISEIPTYLLIRNGKIYMKLDSNDNIIDKINDLVNGKPIKIEPCIGNIISTITLNSGALDLSDNYWHLILFLGSETDYFLRHLTQIQDENPDWSKKLKLSVIDKSEELIEVILSPGMFIIVHKSEVIWKGDTSCTDIYHMLKNLLTPTVLTRDEFQQKKSRLEYSSSIWVEKYPTCPLPSVNYTFSRKFLFNSESYEERKVELTGRFLTCHKEYIEEYFEILSSFFPNAYNSSSYEGASHTISPGEQCSSCDNLLEENQYLCVYCKPAQYFCENCSHSHPVFMFTPEATELDNLTWGAFNLNLGNIEGGVHLDVICNLCKEKISGVRWKCAVCSDFDVCSGCLKESKTHSIRHIMIRILS